MSMSTAPSRNDVLQPKSGVVDPDHPLHDPDLIKMAESGAHSRTVDLLVLATRQSLGDDVWVFRDLNWYPTDGGNAIAPDVMVVPRSAVGEPPKSYRQHQTDGPDPLVVVEVASDTDGFASLLAKTRRYQRLGPPAYVVALDDEPDFFRLGPGDRDLISWLGRPVEELGGFTIDIVDGRPQVTMPDGTAARDHIELLTSAHQRADQARNRADQARNRADRAEDTAEALRAQLRSLGVEPDS